MSLVMLCFPCCVDEQPPPRRRPKIDRNMIGEPMGFKHTGHIGSGEVSTGFDIHNVQDQMQSKGGYEYSCNLSTTEPEGLDLSAHDTKDNGVHDTHESDQSNATEVRQEEAQVVQAAESQGTKENEIHVTLNEAHGTKDDSQESSRTPEQNQL